MEKVKFDLSKVAYEEITGERFPIEEKVSDFRKILAEYFYYKTSNLALRVFAMDLYKSQVVEVDRGQLLAIKEELVNLKLMNPVFASFSFVLDSCLSDLDKAETKRN